jgi:chromosome segregation ATPase
VSNEKYWLSKIIEVAQERISDLEEKINNCMREELYLKSQMLVSKYISLKTEREEAQHEIRRIKNTIKEVKNEHFY